MKFSIICSTLSACMQGSGFRPLSLLGYAGLVDVAQNGGGPGCREALAAVSSKCNRMTLPGLRLRSAVHLLDQTEANTRSRQLNHPDTLAIQHADLADAAQLGGGARLQDELCAKWFVCNINCVQESCDWMRCLISRLMHPSAQTLGRIVQHLHLPKDAISIALQCQFL